MSLHAQIEAFAQTKELKKTLQIRDLVNYEFTQVALLELTDVEALVLHKAFKALLNHAQLPDEYSAVIEAFNISLLPRIKNL